jgi:hypothetical protein
MKLAVILSATLLSAAALGRADPPGQTLGTIKRIYIESLGSSMQAIMLHDMVAASLANSGLVTVTENAAHADAVLRGSADDQIFVEQHHSSDNLSIGLRGSKATSQSSRYDRSSDSTSSGLNAGENEQSSSVERRHEAALSVRLVNTDGDVIWSATQESGGAKLKSASADVADRILQKLTADIQKARSVLAGMPTR